MRHEANQITRSCFAVYPVNAFYRSMVCLASGPASRSHPAIQERCANLAEDNGLAYTLAGNANNLVWLANKPAVVSNSAA